MCKLHAYTSTYTVHHARVALSVWAIVQQDLKSLDACLDVKPAKAARVYHHMGIESSSHDPESHAVGPLCSKSAQLRP